MRSGSTILYNIVRLLYEEKYGDDVYSCWIQRYQKVRTEQFHIIKIHKFDKRLIQKSTKILTSRRDFRDVAASLTRKGWTVNKSADCILDKVLERYEPWFTRLTYDMIYEEMMDDQVKIIREVSKALEFDTTDEEVTRIHNTLKSLRYDSKGNKNSTYNETNLFHLGHATSTGAFGDYKKTLSEDAIKKIENKFPDWLYKPKDENV